VLPQLHSHNGPVPVFALDSSSPVRGGYLEAPPPPGPRRPPDLWWSIARGCGQVIPPPTHTPLGKTDPTKDGWSAAIQSTGAAPNGMGFARGSNHPTLGSSAARPRAVRDRGKDLGNRLAIRGHRRRSSKRRPQICTARSEIQLALKATRLIGHGWDFPPCPRNG